MATKKKELLEQENSAPETTVPVENTPPTDETQADMAAPSDGGDLNELLASMDQTDEDAAPMADGGTLPEQRRCYHGRRRQNDEHRTDHGGRDAI